MYPLYPQCYVVVGTVPKIKFICKENDCGYPGWGLICERQEWSMYLIGSSTMLHNEKYKLLPVNLLPARNHPTIGAGRVPRISQMLVNRCPSRSGPSVVAFCIKLFDSSRIWIDDGGTVKIYKNTTYKYRILKCVCIKLEENPIRNFSNWSLKCYLEKFIDKSGRSFGEKKNFFSTFVYIFLPRLNSQ